jgi:phosphoserine phosphatase
MALTSKRAAFFDVDNTLIRGSVLLGPRYVSAWLLH